MTRPASTAALAVAAGLVVALAVAARVLSSGYCDLDTARQCRSADLPWTAIDYYARAARWYLPVVGAHAEARQALAGMATEAQAAGLDDLALRGWRELSGAILGTRWLTTPDADLLDQANRGIARLMARQDAALRPGRALDEGGHLALLQRDASPNPGWAAAAVLLFVAWIGVTGAGAWRSVTPDGRLRGLAAVSWGSASLVLLAGWLVALGLS